MNINESRENRFKRIATRRTNNILHQMRLLGNLSNKSSYDYSDDDIIKIFSALENQIRLAKAKFHFTKKKEFKL